MFNRNLPFNDLPPLPPTAEVETVVVLKKAISASRAMAELKGMAERMPNQAMLIDSLVLQERQSIHNVLNITHFFNMSLWYVQATNMSRRMGRPRGI